MFRWYHKNVKQYERWIFLGILGVIIIAFVFTGVAGETESVFEGDGEKANLAIEAPTGNVTRQEFDELVFRWSQPDILLANPYDPDPQNPTGMSTMAYFALRYGRSGLYSQMEDMFRMFSLLGRPERELLQEVGVDVFTLMSAAKSAGIRVANEEVIQEVKDRFARAGGFDAEKYGRVLERIGMKADQYENTVREFLLCTKYLEIVEGGVAISAEDVFNEYVKANERAKGRFVSFEGSKYELEARRKTTAKDVAEFLSGSEHTPGFRSEERARAEFVIARFDTLMKDVKEPTEEEIQKYYDTHKEEFRKVELGPRLPGTEPDDHDHDHDHDRDGTPGAEPPKEGEAKPEPPREAAPEPPKDPYEPLSEVKGKVVEKIKKRQAEDKAFEIMPRANDRIFDLQMKGTERPDLGVIAKEFNLEVGTTPWFTGLDSKSLESQLGDLVPGNPLLTWQDLIEEDPKTAGTRQARTDKGHIIIRLVEKEPAKAYLPTPLLRDKAVDRLWRQNAPALATKAAEAFQEEVKKRYEAKLPAAGAPTPTEEEKTRLRIEVFTAVAAEQKVEVRETALMTRDETIRDVPDSRALNAELFNLQVLGDWRTAFGQNATWVVQLLEKKPARADQYQAKKKTIEGRLLMEKKGKFVKEMVEQYKKDVLKIHVEAAAKKVGAPQ